MRCSGNNLSKQICMDDAHPVYGAFGCACKKQIDART